MAVRLEWHDGIPALAAEWGELADRAGAGPFARPEWFEAWARAFDGGGEPRVLTARRDGELVAVLPVGVRGGVVASPTNWHTPAFDLVASDPAVAGEMAAELVARATTRLDLGFLDPAGPLATACLEAAAGRRTIVRPILRSPYLDLGGGDFEAYEATRPSKVRRELNRRRKRLEELGAVTVEFTDGREDLERQLAEGFAVEGSGWKVERGTAIASQPETQAFYTEVARWAAGRGWLQLGFLRLDGAAVAFSYCLVVDGVVHVVKVGFDPERRRFAPGSLLTRAAIERAFGQGLARYDFLGQDDRYKLDWTDDVRERVRLQAFGSSPAGLGSYLAWRHGRPAAKRLAGLLGRDR